MDSAALARKIAEIARELEHETSAQDTMELTARWAVETIPRAQGAGITVAHRDHGPETQAATGDLGLRVDELQYELGEGPCLSAVWDEEVVITPDLEREERWPAWAAAAVRETEVRSMLCFRLFTRDRRLGALNLYATAADAFSSEDIETGALFAAHAAVAIAGAQQLDNAELGLDTRTTIGQAQGILMERFDLDPVRAFEVLRRISSHANRKLNAVALELVTTRRLPVDPQG